jgi:hypothetical protein
MTIRHENGGWSDGAMIAMAGLALTFAGMLVGLGIAYQDLVRRLIVVETAQIADVALGAVMHDQQRTNEQVIDQHSSEIEMIEGKLGVMQEYHQRTLK